jgi:hypothetical protein
MKTLNFENFETIKLSVEEMICVRGGDENEGDPVAIPSQPPVKV